ncbi:MAG: hypothetical protein LC779_13495 [Actinobacteria bacterium]|nr:hypothetical protein [Actinomycetota bacterium]
MEIWLEDGAAVVMRVGSFGPTVEFSPQEARQLGLAFQELADKGASEGSATDGGRE